MVSLTLPWPPKLLSPNVRKAEKLKRIHRRAYRNACAEAAWRAGVNPGERAWRLIALVFHPTNACWDHDNCVAAFKAGQDGLADAMGADDRAFNSAERRVADPVEGGAVIAHLQSIPA